MRQSDEEIVLIGSASQDVLLSGNLSFTIQNTSNNVVRYKIKGSDNKGGLILQGQKVSFSNDITIWANEKANELTNVYLYRDAIQSTNSGTVTQHVKDVTPFNIADHYTFDIAGGDFMNFARSANGQQFTEISVSPLTGDTQTIVEYKTPFQFPCYSEIEVSISQRTKGDYVVMEITDKDTSYVDAPTEYTFTSLTQTTTTLTATLNAAFDGYIGSWVDIYKLLDTRFNYTNLCVATISSDKKTLTFTTSDEAALPSLTATPTNLVGGKLKRQSKLLLVGNALGMRFTGTSATTTAYLARFGGGSIKETGTLGASKLVTCASTAPTYTAGSMGNVEIKATSRFRLEAEPEVIVFGDKGVDALANLAIRNTFTAVKPVASLDYYVRFRTISPISISRPIAKIVSAVKATATTTATITTDVPHGLTTTSYVTIKGIANQTVFANFATPTVVSSIVSPTQFTIVIGTATIATSYGGTVILCNGSVDQQGIIGQVPQSVARDANGLVTIVGNGTWAGLGGVGEYVNLYGCRSSVDGSDLGVDGVYRVHNFATTTLILEPVKDLAGNIIVNGLGNAVTPTGGVITTTNCGGAVILRTTLRSHDIVLATYSQSQIKIMGQGSYRTDMALPVVHLGTLPVAQSTGASISGTTGLGGWYMHPAIVGLPDIASAAITASATSSAVANNLGNGFQINVAVTAVAGTTPTLDIRIEESFDGGTNWVTLYEMQRITATGSYNSPIMRATGRHIRYVRTVGGTSPSFTNAVTRNILPFIQAEPQKRLMDRSIVLTTLNSVTPVLFSGAANNVQLIINLGTATTPPVLQIEGSEDGINFYAMGTPLAGVASSTVQATISGLSATYVRARVSIVGATVVAGYVSLKAWS